MQLVEVGLLDLDRPLVSYLGRDYVEGEPRHLVYLMFAKSSDSRLRHRDWRWADQLQQVADAVHARTGIRVGCTLATAPGPEYGAFWQYYNVTSMASAPALWRHAAVLGIQPYSPESFLGRPEVSDEDRADAKRGFYEGWLRSGLPVILGMVPYYRVEPDGAPPLDNPPLFGTSSGWLSLQIDLLRDLPVQGVMYTAWNGYEEGYAGVVGRDFHHDPNATPVARYTRYNRWAKEVFARAKRK